MCCPHACSSIDIIIDSGPEFPMLALNYGVRIYFPKNESDAPSENGTELWSQDLLSDF